MSRRALQSMTSTTIIRITSTKTASNILMPGGQRAQGIQGSFWYYEGAVRLPQSDWLNGYIILNKRPHYPTEIFFVSKDSVPHFAQKKGTFFSNLISIARGQSGELWVPSTTKIVQTWSAKQFDQKLKQYLRTITPGQHGQSYLVQISQRIRNSSAQSTQQFEKFIQQRFSSPFGHFNMEYMYTRLELNPFTEPDKIIVFARFVYSFLENPEETESQFLEELVNRYTAYIISNIKNADDIEGVVNHLMRGKTEPEKTVFRGILLGVNHANAKGNFQVGKRILSDRKKQQQQQQAKRGGSAI